MIFFYLTFGIISYRVTGKVKLYFRAGNVCDFGFFKGGEYDFTFRNNITKFEKALSRVFLMTRKQYDSFQNALLEDELDFAKCDFPEAYDKFLINFTDNYDEIKYGNTVDVKQVYYTVVMNCDYQLAKDNDVFFFDAVYMNPGGQLLDYREIPKLKIYPAFMGIFSFVLIAFIVVLICYKRHFLKMYIFIIVCCLMYILFLVFSLLALKYSSTHEDHSKWEICLTVFECLYCICLFSLLVILSTGWCILNVELDLKKTLISILSITVMFAMLYLQINVELGYIELIFFFLEIISMFFIAKALFENTKKAETMISAHLYVINQKGIDPKTTPIYEKYKMYHLFLYLNLFLFLFIIIINSILGLFTVDDWLQSLINISFQLFAIINPMIIFRPRGKGIDKYMESDMNESLLENSNNDNNGGLTDEPGERNEVMLDDLDGFDPRKTQGTEWQDGMELPLQPIVVGQEVSKKPMRNNTDITYTTIEEPLNQFQDKY